MPQQDNSTQESIDLDFIQERIKSVLTKKEYKLIQMHFDGYKYPEIAKKTKLSPAQVFNRIHKIKTILQTHLK